MAKPKPEGFTKKQWTDVLYRVGDEGLEYTFMHYSDFEDVKDAKFHELRKAYIAAAKALDEYLGTDEESDEDELDDDGAGDDDLDDDEEDEDD